MTNSFFFFIRPLFFCIILLLCPFSILAFENNRLLLAEKLFNENLFNDAADIYVEVLSSDKNVDSKISNEILERLGKCYLHSEEYQKAINLLKPASDADNNTISYILAIAHRQLGQNIQALQYLESIENRASSKNIEMELNFEIALNHFHLKNFSKAREIFLSVLNNKKDSSISKKATLYLIRIDLIEKNFQDAEDLLKNFHLSTNEKSIEYKEYLYLRGLTFLSQSNIKKASAQFEQALKLELPQHSLQEWEIETVYLLISTYLHEIRSHASEKLMISDLFNKAEETINNVSSLLRNEKFYLTLIEIYSLKAFLLNDPSSHELFEKIASNNFLVSSEIGKEQILLFKAASTLDFHERERLYEEISSKPHHSPIFSAKIYFLMGLNEFEEALKIEAFASGEAGIFFDKAANSFSKSFTIYKDIAPLEGIQALKYQALALFNQKNLSKQMEAWNLINQAIQKKEFSIGLEDLYLVGSIFAFELIEKREAIDPKELDRILSQGLSFSNENSKYAELLRITSLIEIKRKKWASADVKLNEFINLFPDSPFCGEALYWRSVCADHLEKNDLKQNLLREIYEKYPTSSYAPQAYFNFYSYQDYSSGSKKMIKHLQNMETFFPNSPLLIKAYYLIGMDLKKDHYSPEGKLHRRKNLTASIDTFNKAESIFDRLSHDHFIPNENISYYVSLKYQSILERALSNFEVAKESQGAKKRIFLEYAREVLRELQSHFKNKTHQTNLILTVENYPRIWEETEYRLAEVYMEEEKLSDAEAVLNDMLTHYTQDKANSSYFLSRLWYKKGVLAKQSNHFSKAFSYFTLADETGLKLSTDERLENWIQQSECCKRLNQLDDAMKLLSKVINDESISNLRLKAMFLRAEIYQLQDKPELAFKQLEALSKKGGTWAQKAKEELDFLSYKVKQN